MISRRCLAVLFVPVILCATNDAQTQDSAKKPQTVYTRNTKVDGELKASAQRVERISSKDLARRGVTNLAEALAWLSAGQDISPTGTSSALIVDGLPGAQLTILRDGLPIARPSGSPQGPIVDLSAIPLNPAAVERIDIYRGVGPVGSGAAGGVVVDIITRRQKTKHNGFAQTQLQGAQSSVASQNYVLGGNISLPGHLQWNLLGFYTAAEALDINKDNTPDTPARQDLHGETTLTWRLSHNEYLRAQFLATRANTQSIAGLQAPLDDQVRRRNLRLRVRGRWWLTPDLRLDHHSDFGHQNSTFEKLVRSSGFVRPKAQTTQLETLQAGVLTWFIAKHTLALEFNGNLRHIERSGETGDLPAVSMNDVGVGLSDTWQIHKRVETFTRLYADIASPFGVGLNAHLGGVWKLNDHVAWRVALSRSQRRPTAEELYLFFDHSEVGYRIQGNDALVPEQLNSARSGLIITGYQQQLGVELQGFYHRLHNAINVISTPDDAALFTYANIAQAETAGVQLTTQLRKLPGGLQLLGNYTFLPVARDVTTGDRLNTRSYHSGRVELRGSWLNRKLEAWTDLQSRSALQVPDDSPAAPAFWLWGAGVGYHPGQQVSFILDANNILDQKNATWGPAPGFNVLARVRIGFEAN